jgi:hypothetical protein
VRRQKLSAANDPTDIQPTSITWNTLPATTKQLAICEDSQARGFFQSVQSRFYFDGLNEQPDASLSGLWLPKHQHDST